MVQVTDAVTFVDSQGSPHFALVTAVFAGAPGDNEHPSVNVMYVSDDPKAEDQYGRQTVREASVVNQVHQSGHGMFWHE